MRQILFAAIVFIPFTVQAQVPVETQPFPIGVHAEVPTQTATLGFDFDPDLETFDLDGCLDAAEDEYSHCVSSLWSAFFGDEHCVEMKDLTVLMCHSEATG